jgi:hypothetical protein
MWVALNGRWGSYGLLIRLASADQVGLNQVYRDVLAKKEGDFTLKSPTGLLRRYPFHAQRGLKPRSRPVNAKTGPCSKVQRQSAFNPAPFVQL